MTTLLFVRHGETDWNRQGRFQGSQDIPLNDEGRSQARRLAQSWTLGGEVLLTSPLARARETAELLGAALGLVPRWPDPRLVERSYGQGEGLTLAQRRERWPGEVPGAEAPSAVAARAQAFLDAVSVEHPGRRVIAVSHGGFINTVLGLVSNGLYGSGKTLLANASVSVVELDSSGWRVAEVGLTFEAQALGLRE